MILLFDSRTSSKAGFIIGTSVGIFEENVGYAMILLMDQMQTMLKSVIVFQRPDPNFKLKTAIYCLAGLLSSVPIILSWIFYSDRAVELLDYYYLPCLFGFLTLLLTYFSIIVVI